MMKWCAYGKHDVDASLFAKNRARPDGLDTRCKPCNLKKYHDGGAEEKAKRVEQARRRREALIADLGGVCVCCGESTYEFLQIDHINNNGAEHRSLVGRKSLNIADLRKVMDELQVLCANCHLAKSSWGACPHLTWKAIWERPVK